MFRSLALKLRPPKTGVTVRVCVFGRWTVAGGIIGRVIEKLNEVRYRRESCSLRPQWPQVSSGKRGARDISLSSSDKEWGDLQNWSSKRDQNEDRCRIKSSRIFSALKIFLRDLM
jgi:hypothetical protein